MVQGSCISPHFLLFFAAVSLEPFFCRLTGALDPTSSIAICPAASSALSHSPHCSLGSPGWPSCHLTTSARALPVHWPGLEAPRISTTSRPYGYAHETYVAVHYRNIAYVENGLSVYIFLQSKFFDAICEIIVLADQLRRGFGCAKNNQSKKAYNL